MFATTHQRSVPNSISFLRGSPRCGLRCWAKHKDLYRPGCIRQRGKALSQRAKQSRRVHTMSGSIIAPNPNTGEIGTTRTQEQIEPTSSSDFNR